MLSDRDHRKIRGRTERLLHDADADGRWPTRVDDLVAAADLTEPEESPLDSSVLARAPRYLRKAVELINSGKIRAILDRRERTVHLDPSISNDGRRSFLRLHEVSHDILEWQRDPAFADDDGTLSPQTDRRFEREANQGAAELLFQGDRFAALTREYRIGMAAVSELSAIVGSSLRATLRRYAESHDGAVCAIAVEPSPRSRAPLRYKRWEVSQSEAWGERFGSTWPPHLSVDCFPFLNTLTGEELGSETLWPFPDLNLEMVEVRAEAVATPYAGLLLLWVPRRETFKRRRRLEVAAT